MSEFQKATIHILVLTFLLSNSACGVLMLMDATTGGPGPDLSFVGSGTPRKDIETELGKPACIDNQKGVGMERVIYSFNVSYLGKTRWLEVAYDKEDKVKEYLFFDFKPKACKSADTIKPNEDSCDPGSESCPW